MTNTLHKNDVGYLHNLENFVNFRDSQLASCSEDGSVRLWDLRKRENTNILTPHLVDKVARPRIGKWIGAVDFTEDWLVGNNNIFI